MRDQSKLYQFKSVLRWVGAPLLLAGLISWSVAPAYPAHAQQAEAAKQTGKADKADGSKPASNEELQKLNEKLEKLDEATKQNYLLALDGERKQVDWWLTLLGVLAAIMAIAGGLIPYLMARKDKEIIEQDKAQIRRLLEEVKSMRYEAEDSVEEIHRHEAEAEAAKKAIMNYQSGTPASENEQIQEAAETIENDKTADPVLRLRAEAVSASKSKNAGKAFKLWAALAELVEKDASVHFNAGYWAHGVGDEAHGQEKLSWLHLAGQYYAQALSLEPGKYEAAYNWGNALDEEARVLSNSDLAAARACWKQAGEKYQQALSIKPDMPEAACSWGSALDDEARAISSIDLDAARALWRLAGEKYKLALALKPDMHEAATNWGHTLALEARALSTINLAEARQLWKRAGEKYQLTLALKPGKSKAVNSWCSVLMAEARYIELSAPAESERLLDQAEQLLLQYAESSPELFAYNLACVYGIRGDVQSCLKWLRVEEEHQGIDCEHLRTDKDLDPVRNDPAFIEWLQQVCPS